jgi:hypothetical protein
MKGSIASLISLNPSIGNWSYACKSHYWIEQNRVAWAPRWTKKQIDEGRASDRYAKRNYFGAGEAKQGIPTSAASQPRGFWSRVKAKLRRQR